MPVEMVQMIFGLLLGLAIALFHRRIADFMLQQERALDYVFRMRGLRLPPPSETTTRNIYFAFGIAGALIQAGRLWLLLLRGI